MGQSTSFTKKELAKVYPVIFYLSAFSRRPWHWKLHERLVLFRGTLQRFPSSPCCDSLSISLTCRKVLASLRTKWRKKKNSYPLEYLRKRDRSLVETFTSDIVIPFLHRNIKIVCNHWVKYISSVKRIPPFERFLRALSHRSTAIVSQWKHSHALTKPIDVSLVSLIILPLFVADVFLLGISVSKLDRYLLQLMLSIYNFIRIPRRNIIRKYLKTRREYNAIKSLFYIFMELCIYIYKS